jgi:hypothetical protein
MTNKNHPHRIGFTDKCPVNILERFYHNLPAWPHCMSGLNQPSFQRSKDEAIEFPYIQLNKLRRAYICLDIDRSNAMCAHKEVGMPDPTIILVNPDNGHAHIFYELQHPVPFTGRARKGPQQYFISVQKALTLKFHADEAFSANIVKNPFHNTQRGGKWQRVFNCVQFDLKTLACNADLKNYRRGYQSTSKWQSLEKPILKGLRNVTVFDIVRRFSYEEIKNHASFENFFNSVRLYSMSLNKRQCMPPLPVSELDYIVERICNWVWDNRNQIGNYSIKEKGVMGFEPISSDLDISERRAEIKRREQEGAKYTHSKQKRKTEEAIIKAIKQLKTEDKKVTKSAVARLAGISRETISKRYKDFFK